MADIKLFTDFQLERELLRRKEEAKKKSLPQPLDNINIAEIKNTAIMIRDAVANNGHVGNNDEHWCFEAVMQSVFGKDYWNWHNENVK